MQRSYSWLPGQYFPCCKGKWAAYLLKDCFVFIVGLERLHNIWNFGFHFRLQGMIKLCGSQYILPPVVECHITIPFMDQALLRYHVKRLLYLVEYLLFKLWLLQIQTWLQCKYFTSIGLWMVERLLSWLALLQFQIPLTKYFMFGYVSGLIHWAFADCETGKVIES